MNKQETLSYSYSILRGILANYRDFKSDVKDTIQYDFDCPEYAALKDKYRLSEIAGKGDRYSRAKRLLIHFSKRMTHDSMYAMRDDRAECNALAILEYCYDNPAHGINCLNKAKVLTECCLALGIPARRMSIMPFSPYDGDNHVVTEIYDDKMKKWIMMDPTTGGIFADENKTPLSLLEMRDRFANNSFLTFMSAGSRATDPEQLERKELENNWYICKNSFYFVTQKYQGFGVRENDRLYFVPKGYSLLENSVKNLNYKIDLFGKEYPNIKKNLEEQLEKTESSGEPCGCDISALTELL